MTSNSSQSNYFVVVPVALEEVGELAIFHWQIFHVSLGLSLISSVLEIEWEICPCQGGTKDRMLIIATSLFLSPGKVLK